MIAEELLWGEQPQARRDRFIILLTSTLSELSATINDRFVFYHLAVKFFFNFSLHYDSDKILYRYELTEEESGELMTDRLHFLFLEMTNCPSRKPQSRDSFIEKLSYALTQMQWLKERPAEHSEQVFGLLFEACEITSLNEETQQEYTNDIMTTEMDRKNILYTRELRGYERGQMDGREEGREEGFEEGRKEERINNARNLKALGVDMAIIAKATGLLEDQIEAL